VGPNGATLARLGELLGDGRLRINLDRAFPLDSVAEAHAVGDRGHVRGLLVLDVR
jgi:NADPH:quinone reductase